MPQAHVRKNIPKVGVILRRILCQEFRCSLSNNLVMKGRSFALMWSAMNAGRAINNKTLTCVCVTEVGCSWGGTGLVTFDLRTSIY